MTSGKLNQPTHSLRLELSGRLAMLVLLLVIPATHAAVFDIPDGLVEINGDDGQCSLIEAFENISNGAQLHADCPAPAEPGLLNTVNLAPGSEYLFSEMNPDTSTYLDFISEPVALVGNNAILVRPPNGDDAVVFDAMLDADRTFSLSNVTLDGGGLASPLIVHGGGELSLVSVTVRNTGIGIDAFEEILISVSIDSSRFENAGAGLLVSGSDNVLVTIAVTVFDQVQLGVDLFNAGMNLSQSGFAGGGTGVRIAGAQASATIANSTFSGQLLGLDAEAGNTMVNNATFASNQQAISAFINGTPTVSVANSIFADSATLNCDGGGVVSLGFNLSTDTSCVGEATDLAETDPMLGALQDFHHPLEPGSPAISASQNPDTPCENVDQRGVARPQDGNNDGNPQCDIGAFERQPDPQPAIVLTKSILSGSPYVSAGDVIEYSLEAANTGNVALQNVVINDPDLPVLDCEMAQPAVLEAGETQLCNGSYVVDQDDVDAGSFTNTATVTGQDIFGTPVSDQDSATAVGPAPGPAIALSKTATDGAPFSAVGDVITYALVATNSGNLTLTNVGINDPLLGVLNCNPAQPATLEPDQSLACAGSYTVTQADIDTGSVANTATVAGRDPDNNLVSAQASHVVQGPAADPSIVLVKTITEGASYSSPGDTVNYSLEITNSGNVSLSDAVLSDPGLDSLDCSGTGGLEAATDVTIATRTISQRRMIGDSAVRFQRMPAADNEPAAESPAVSLAPGETFDCTGEYTVTESDISTGSYTNTATVSARSPANVLVSDQDSAIARGPLLLFPAEADLGVIDVGETFTATFHAVGGVPPYAFAATGLPEGWIATITDDGVVISGAGQRAGRIEFSISVSDSVEPPEKVQRNYQLRLATDLELAPVTLADGIQGVDYFQALNVTNGIPPYTFQASMLPPGLELTRNIISGRPSQNGTFEISVIAVDAHDNVGEAIYALTVTTPGFSTSSLELPDAVVNVSYSHQLLANSSDNPVVWSDAAGLPTGLELQYTGFIAGKPLESGTFQISARATNAQGQMAELSAPLVVLDRGVINTVAQLPPGVVGRRYGGPLSIFGSDPPFGCQAPSGELPTGLELVECNQGVAGIPEVPGSFAFELLVTDSATPASSDRGRFSIRIADPEALLEVPDLRDAPAVTVPVADYGQGRPDAGFPDESLQQLAIDGFGNRVLVGYSYNGDHYDILILSFDSDGTLNWSQRFDSGDHDYGYGVTINPVDQGIYVTGFVLNGNRYEGVLLSFDANGVLRWEERVTGGVLTDALYGVAADREGVYVTGERYNGVNFDAIYAGYTHEGIPLWSHLRTSASTQTGYVVNADPCELPPCPLLVGGSEGVDLSQGWMLAVDRGSGALIAQQSLSQGGVLALASTSDGWVTGGDTPANQWHISRIDRNLQPVWTTTFPEGQRLRGMVADEADFIYAAGRTGVGQDALLTLLAPEGQVLQSRSFDTGARDRFNGVGIGPEGVLTAAGERRQLEGNRAILYYLDTGKAF